MLERTGPLDPHVGKEHAEVADTACVCPLIVVPGSDLDEVTPDDIGRHPIDDAGAFIPLHVHRDYGVHGDIQDTSHGPCGCLPEQLVELFLCGIPLGQCHDFDDGDRRRRNAVRKPIELPIHFGNDKAKRLGSTGRCRHDVEGT